MISQIRSHIEYLISSDNITAYYLFDILVDKKCNLIGRL